MYKYKEWRYLIHVFERFKLSRYLSATSGSLEESYWNIR